MNYLSVGSPILDWPEIAPKAFAGILTSMDYVRDGWCDGIVYKERYTGRMFAFQKDRGGIHIHPDLYEYVE